MQRSIVLLLPLLAALGCDLLFAAPPAVIGGRDRDGDEGEGEEPSEGEGEGEGEPGVPPDIEPHPLGPSIQSFSSSLNRLNDNDSTTLTVVVTDPDGAEDIIGPLLIEPISGSTLGTLTQSAPGTFTATVNWDLLSTVEAVEFIRGGDVRFIRVQFSDNAGHQVTKTQQLDLFCEGDLPACDNTCARLRCQDECLQAPFAPSADDLCGGCNIGCTSAGTNGTCFNPAPSCAGGGDCLFVFETSDEQPDNTTCHANGGVTLRDDNFAVWRVDGDDLAVGMVLSNSSEIQQLGQALCAPFGGLLRRDSFDALGDLDAAPYFVVDVDDPACLVDPSTCEPVLGSREGFVNFTAQKFSCIEPLDPSQGTFGNDCFNDDCTDGSVCDGFTCIEACSTDPECDLCSAAAGTACTCDVNAATCVVPPDEGDFGEPCIGGTFGTCNGGNLFCASGVCDEGCDQVSDCVSCPATTGGECRCDTVAGTCEVGAPVVDFSCVTSTTREITTTGTFSGSTSGAPTTTGTCGASGGGGPEQAWKFTPSTTGSFTFTTIAGFDTALYVRTACTGGTELDCDDDGGAANNNSRLTVSLTRGVPVVVFVDGFDTSAFGSYQLTVSSP